MTPEERYAKIDARLDAIAVVFRTRTENSLDAAVARQLREVFAANDGRRAEQQRGDHNDSCHAAHASMATVPRQDDSRIPEGNADQFDARCPVKNC